MRRPWWLLWSGMCSAAMLAVASAAQQAGQPKIVLSAEGWNFGEVVHLSKLEYDLGVSNQGTADLRIREVRTGCGCTVAELAKYVLKPGESTTVHVTFNTKLKKGKVSYPVTIVSNDPASPEKVFTVEGFVKRVLQVEPEWGASLRVLDPSESRTQTVRIFNPTDQPMKPQMGEFKTGKFTARLKEVQPGKEYLVEISNVPPIKERTTHDQLEITTGLADEPKVEVGAYYAVVDRVHLLSGAVLISGDKDKPCLRTVEVHYYGDDPRFRVLEAGCEDPRVSVRTFVSQPPAEAIGGLKSRVVFTIALEFPPQYVAPPGGLLFRVKTNDPEYPELTFRATDDVALYRTLVDQARETSQRRPATSQP
jgi:hypothetical protein